MWIRALCANHTTLFFQNNISEEKLATGTNVNFNCS